MSFKVAPLVVEKPRRVRRPRLLNERHLRFIRSLPCAICGTRRGVEAAHLRTGCRLVGKRETGLSERPSDQWTLPLCGGPQGHHAEQHQMGEIEFWRRYGIDNPWQLCLALFAASHAEDSELAELIIAEHRLRG